MLAALPPLSCQSRFDLSGPPIVVDFIDNQNSSPLCGGTV
jgi:hypothetical protein